MVDTCKIFLDVAFQEVGMGAGKYPGLPDCPVSTFSHPACIAVMDKTSLEDRFNNVA